MKDINKINKLYLKPCPFCGFQLDSEDEDCIHPIHSRIGNSTTWAVNCYESGGGCSANILGESMAEAIINWNRRESR